MFNIFKSKTKIKEQEKQIYSLQNEISVLKNQQLNMISLNEHKNILKQEITSLANENSILNQELYNRNKKNEIYKEQEKQIYSLQNEISVLKNQQLSMISLNEHKNILKNKMDYLVNENSRLNQELYNRNKKNEIYKEQAKAKKEQEKIQKQQNEYYYNHIEEYYFFKSSVFTSNEQYLYYYLDKWTKSKQYNITDKYYDKYKIFPKIRLADIIAIDEEKKKLYQEVCNCERSPIVYEITSKHIDFTICEIVGSGLNIKYKPILFIELNGKSHKNDELTKKNDKFKENLFNALSIPIITIENNQLHDICINEKISNFLEKFLKKC